MDYPYPHCKCGKIAILKDGKHGKFFACPDWPKCSGETCSYESWVQFHKNESIESLNSMFDPIRGDNATRRELRNIINIAARDPLSPDARLVGGPDVDMSGEIDDPEWEELDKCFASW